MGGERALVWLSLDALIEVGDDRHTLIEVTSRSASSWCSSRRGDFGVGALTGAKAKDRHFRAGRGNSLALRHRGALGPHLPVGVRFAEDQRRRRQRRPSEVPGRVRRRWHHRSQRPRGRAQRSAQSRRQGKTTTGSTAAFGRSRRTTVPSACRSCWRARRTGSKTAAKYAAYSRFRSDVVEKSLDDANVKVKVWTSKLNATPVKVWRRVFCISFRRASPSARRSKSAKAATCGRFRSRRSRGIRRDS